MTIGAELNRLHRRLLLKTSGERYAALFNLRSTLRRQPFRVDWTGETYVVQDPEMPMVRQHFRHEKQGNMAYEHGLVRRAELLGQAYRLDQIKFCDGDAVIDCGANVGDLRLWFRLKGLEICYRAFEPSPIEFGCLALNCPNDEYHNVGLWSADGNLEFYVSSQGADSSLIEPVTYDSIIRVQTRKLSAFIDGPVKLLKLEAEGAEPEILEGAEDELHRIEFISADLGFERGVNCESTLVPVTNFLISRGFELMAVGHRRIYALFRNRAFPLGR